MEYKTISHRDDIHDYLSVLSNAINKAIAVTDCKVNQLTGDELGDALLKAALEMLNTSMTALKYKFAMQGVVDKLPTNFTYYPKDSGWPTSKMFAEMQIELANNFSTYQLSSLPDLQGLKKRLLNIAMEERRKCRKTQFEIGISRYAEILKAEESWPEKPQIKVFPMDKAQGLFRAIGTCVDPTVGYPALYLMDFRSTAQELNMEKVEKVLPALSGLMDCRNKLLVIGGQIDEKFEEIVPVKLERIFMGGVYMDKFTDNPSHIQSMFECSVKPESKFMFQWTLETLRTKGDRDVSTGLFSRNIKKASFDVDYTNPEFLDAGVTSIQRSVIMPYELYQEVDGETPRLDSYKKYVVDEKNNVIVF